MPKLCIRRYPTFIIILILLLTFIPSVSAGKGGFIIMGGGENVKKVCDGTTFDTEQGLKKIDLCIKYNYFSIFFIPIVKYDKQYVGCCEEDQNFFSGEYYELTTEEIQEMADNSGYKLDTNIFSKTK